MNEPKDGGSAFPGAKNGVGAPFNEGMSLRDYFAAAALPMAWESEHHKPTFGNSPLYKGVANRAYLIADAMLAERNK